ncbi:MAG: homoserine kinase [Actinobacteria bacterium 13_2_20CM_2_71_6]|nr:MAG: homoserine kinase [Actinobacteria bacterium 13_2_20CM_2_71_6]
MLAFLTGPVRVRVPATSANLGPGFDSLGLALRLYDEVTAQVTGTGIRVRVTGEGAGELPEDESHLVVRCALDTFDRLGGRPPGLALTCHNSIPQARGLGSSSAAIVAGILAARALVEGGTEKLDDPAVLRLASEIEGHPDNVAPCLLGGFTIAWEDGPAGKPARPAGGAVSSGEVPPPVGEPAQPSGGQPAVRTSGARAVRLAPADGVHPLVFVPTERGLTAHARAALPATVPHADAARNAGRAALLVYALTAEPALLLPATEDRLHQDYRAPAAPATAALVSLLRAAGIPAVVSGAGPSVLAFAGFAEIPITSGWQLLDVGIDANGAVVGVDSQHAERGPVAAGRAS